MNIFNFLHSKKSTQNTPEESRTDFSDKDLLNMKKALLREQGYSDSQIRQMLGESAIEECEFPLSFNPEKLPTSLMNSEVKLFLYHAGWLDKPDASVFSLMANTDKIRRFLPGLDFSSEANAKNTLVSLIMKTEAKIGFTYVIRANNIPIGMIFVNTPLCNQKMMNLKIWTIDFFIVEGFEHQGIMYNSLIHILNLLKSVLHIEKIYATVDEDNIDCLNLLCKGEQPLFDEINNSGFTDKDHPGRVPKVFVMDLTKINFISNS